MKLSGRRILVTGGGSGIGLELARRLAKDNEVVITGRDEERLTRAQADVPGCTLADWTSPAKTRHGSHWGRSKKSSAASISWSITPDCSAATTLADADAAAMSAEDVEVNLLGSLRMTRLALPQLQASGSGAVVYISSAVALAAVPGFSGRKRPFTRSPARSARS
jgi:uncharacterized oxidoreductase